MADTAAHLVARVLPRAPYRQWVFTVPKPLRLVLARDPAWARWVGQLVVRAIGAWQRRIARARGLVAPRTGAVVFRQRFGGLVNLNVHYHLVVPDGVFVDDGEQLRFVMLPVPTNQDVLAILDRIVRRVVRRLVAEARDDDDMPAASDVLGDHDAGVQRESLVPCAQALGAAHRVAAVAGRAPGRGGFGLDLRERSRSIQPTSNAPMSGAAPVNAGVWSARQPPPVVPWSTSGDPGCRWKSPAAAFTSCGSMNSSPGPVEKLANGDVVSPEPNQSLCADCTA